MLPPRWFLPYDSIIQILTAVIALAVCLYAHRGYKWTQDRTLRGLLIAFLLLALGFFIKGLALGYAWGYGVGYAENGTLVGVLELGFWAYYILSIAAYGILVYAYSKRLAAPGLAMAMAGTTLLLVSPFFELICVILLLVILIAQLMHLMVKRAFNAEVVVMSFTLLLLSHVFLMFSRASDLLFMIGAIIQLMAFASLLLVLYRLRGEK